MRAKTALLSMGAKTAVNKRAKIALRMGGQNGPRGAKIALVIRFGPV